jgi:citrate synthase
MLSDQNLTSDGLKGSIQYRGYSIVDIVKQRKSYLDTAYLLIWGKWPSKKQNIVLRTELGNVPEPHKCVFDTIRSFP